MPSTNVPNIENINRLIAAIEAEEAARFNMANWNVPDDASNPACGTSACIGGMAELLSGRAYTKFDADEGMVLPYEDTTKPSAYDWMGMEMRDTNELFFAQDFGRKLKEEGVVRSAASRYGLITKQAAISALKEIRDTGEFTGWDKHVAAFPAKIAEGAQ